MNSQLALDEYLLLLKSSCEVYVHGTLESAHKDVKDLLRNSLLDIIKSQEDTYNLMVENGFYTVNDVKTSEIQKIITEMNNK